ncbi:MAG: prolyl oligopeptidase family serine peptidase [bacterium]
MRPLLSLLLFLSGTLNAGAAPPGPITSWQILGPFMAAPRDGATDHLLEYGGEDQIVPDASQVFYSEFPDDGILRWETLEVESDQVEVKYEKIDWNSPYRRLGGVGLLNVGYAYTEVESDSDQVVLVRSQRVPGFYVNGRAYQGEPYFAGYHRTAISLQAGKNRILVKFSGKVNRSFRFALEPVKADAMLLKDLTHPDLLPTPEAQSVHLGVPILNTSREWLRTLRLQVVSGASPASLPRTRESSSDAGLSRPSLSQEQRPSPAEFPVPPIPPLGVLKLPLELNLPEGSGSAVSLELVLHGEQELDRMDVELTRKSWDEPQRRTFRSAIDHSVQYYGIRYPQPYDPGRRYPVIFGLHGAGVEAHQLAGQYSAKDWAFVITPTNRRPYGFDWQDWGRLDFLEVYREVFARLPLDPDRVYLAGSSMGGQGVWHIGLHDPSRFAALAPQAGWSGFRHYSPFTLQKSQMFAAPEILGVRDRVMQDSNNPYFLENAQHLPIVITQGRQDTTVPPHHARLFQKLLRERNAPVTNRELADKGHWWDEPRTAGGGSDAVDNEEVMSFLRQQVRRVPRAFQAKLFDLSISHTFHWVKVLAQQEPLKETTVQAQVAGDQVQLVTKNVEALELDLSGLGPNLREVFWNGTRTPVAASPTLRLGPAPDAGTRLSQSHPAFKSVFFQPFVVVYGTQGDAFQDAVLLHRANQIALRFWRVANGFVRVLPDVEVDASTEAEFNLILLGTPESNLLVRRLLPKTPVRLHPDGVELNGKRFSGELAASWIYPHPDFPERMTAFFTGSTPEAEKLSLSFLPLYSGSGTPHYVIFDRQVRRYGWGGVKAAGFFDFRQVRP